MPNINYPGLQWAAAGHCDFLIWLYIIISIVVAITL